METEQKKTLSRKEFNKWYLNFLEQYGGVIMDPLYWYKKCLDSHKDLNNLLGSYERSVFIELKNQNIPLDSNVISSLRDSFYIDCGNYMEDIFPNNFIQGMALPTIKDKHNRSVKTVKAMRNHLISEMKTYYQNRFINPKEKFNEFMSKVQPWFNKLSEEHNKNSTKDFNLEYIISTDPEKFVQLGHYIASANSCYQQCKQFQHAKYWLAQTDGTFVILIKNNGKIAARYWGIYDYVTKSFVISNGYFDKGIHSSTVRNSLVTFISELIEVPEDKLSVAHDLTLYTDQQIYCNEGSVTIVSEKDAKNVPLKIQVDDTEHPFTKTPNILHDGSMPLSDLDKKYFTTLMEIEDDISSMEKENSGANV